MEYNNLMKMREAATQGKWELDDCNNIRISPNGRIIIATVRNGEDYFPSRQDAEYIVAAANSLPEIIVEMNKLRRKNKVLEQTLENIYKLLV